MKAFAVELATIQEGMKNPRVFKASDAKAIPTIEYPDGSETSAQPNTAGANGGVGAAMTFGQPAATPTPDSKKLFEQRASQYAQIFVGASVFTLKRILSEEALSRLDELRIAHDQVAQWYMKHVMRMKDTNIDFGLAERNNTDQDFHLKWAMQVSDDRIKWEVLNRYHRYLNAL